MQFEVQIVDCCTYKNRKLEYFVLESYYLLPVESETSFIDFS